MRVRHATPSTFGSTTFASSTPGSSTFASSTVAPLSLALCLLVGGCAIKPAEVGICDFRRYQLALSDPDTSRRQALAAVSRSTLPGSSAGVAVADVAAAPAAPDGTLAHEIMSVMRNRASGHLVAAQADSMLFLSGGSLHGAYGAGFLAAWQEARGDRKLPEFAVVTGVSTGALLATFAFVSRTDLAVQGYTIRDETEILRPYARISDGNLGSGALTLLRKGAVADLQPLRKRLDGLLSDEVMRAVAQGALGRKLFVGAVNVDTGEAEAFDLGDMATRYVAALDAKAHATGPADGARAASDARRLKDCYIEAVIASSSVPVAAPPVFIDHREYVDGGARFGLFSDEIGKVINDRLGAGSRTLMGSVPLPIEYVIVNGTLRIDAACAVETPCAPPAASGVPAPGESYGVAPHRKWNVLSLALRSAEDVLPNQIYRFSADQIAAQAAATGAPFRFTKINPDLADFTVNIDDPASDTGRKSCAAYQEMDRQPVEPLQFYPRYMRCLIAYGRESAKKRLPGRGWDPEVDAPSP